MVEFMYMCFAKWCIVVHIILQFAFALNSVLKNRLLMLLTTL